MTACKHQCGSNEFVVIEYSVWHCSDPESKTKSWCGALSYVMCVKFGLLTMTGLCFQSLELNPSHCTVGKSLLLQCMSILLLSKVKVWLPFLDSLAGISLIKLFLSDDLIVNWSVVCLLQDHSQHSSYLYHALCLVMVNWLLYCIV